MPEGITRIGESSISARLRILLVEDHLILRQGLRALLESHSDLEIVGEAGTVAEALDLVERLRPTIVMTDIGLPDRSGIELTAELRARGSSARVLVLTAHTTEEHIRAALNAGVTGYVLKDASHAELLAGLRAVGAGRPFLCESSEAKVLSHYASGAVSEQSRAPIGQITNREREVLKRIALGKSNKGIARELELSVKTVEKHRSNVMRKLKLHNTAAITLFAVRHSLLDQQEILGVL
ncbi:MAG TPA: response regulator transcription factor [Steroidobacteraceae bacterium]|nr:response regulator transcription factor [Steroidobacteraceae bacterium]